MTAGKWHYTIQGKKIFLHLVTKIGCQIYLFLNMILLTKQKQEPINKWCINKTNVYFEH